MAGAEAERKHEQGKDNKHHNNTNNSGVARDKGDVEREAIDEESEDEEPSEVVEVAMVRTRPTTCADDGEIVDNGNNMNNNLKGPLGRLLE